MSSLYVRFIKSAHVFQLSAASKSDALQVLWWFTFYFLSYLNSWILKHYRFWLYNAGDVHEAEVRSNEESVRAERTVWLWDRFDNLQPRRQAVPVRQLRHGTHPTQVHRALRAARKQKQLRHHWGARNKLFRRKKTYRVAPENVEYICVTLHILVRFTSFCATLYSHSQHYLTKASEPRG